MTQLPTTQASIGNKIIRAAVTIIFFGMFAKVGGLLMHILVSSVYDRGVEYDVYTAVYGVIVILFFYSSLLKALLPVFMPMFSRLVHERGERDAWRFANTLITLLGIGVVSVCTAVFAFAPQIVATILPEFSTEAQALATDLLRWMSPGLAVTLLAAMAQGILNSYKVFSYPAAAEAAHKMTWAAVLILAVSVPQFRGIEFAARCMGISFLAGCMAQAVILLLGVRKHATYFKLGIPVLAKSRLLTELGILALVGAGFAGFAVVLGRMGLGKNNLKFALLTAFMFTGCGWSLWLWRRANKRSGIMARCAALVAPLLIGILFARYRDLTSAFFQSYVPEGDFAIIELAKRVINLPIVLVAYSLSIAMFPYLCDLAARKETEGLAEIVGRTIRMIAFFFIPLTALTVVMAEPVMQLLADRGTWSPEQIRTAGIALGFASVAIFFMSIENVLMTTFFSLERMVLPTILGIFFSITYSIGLWLVVEQMGYREPGQVFIIVCIAWPLPKILKNICLMFFLHRRIGLFKLRDTCAFAAKLAVICAAISTSAWFIHQLISRAIPLPLVAEKGHMKFELTKCLHVGAASLAALAAFIALAYFLRIEEPRTAIKWLRQKIQKKRAPEA